MMDRHACHRRVDGVVVEGERLCPGLDHWRRACGALGAHRCAWLHGEQPSVARLVGPCARADVEHRARIAERGMDPRGDSRVWAAMLGLCASMALVVDPSRHAPILTSLVALGLGYAGLVRPKSV